MAESRLNNEMLPTEEQDTSSLSNFVFNCIQENNLCKLQNVLKECEKSQRRIIVRMTNNGSAPLFIACLQGKVDFVIYLLDECSADINQKGIYEDAQEYKHEVTPLWWATVMDKVDVVKILVQHDAKINKTSDTRATPVMSACCMSHVYVAKYLVQHGADIHKRNRYGATCLMMAVKNADLCSFLINNGADVNAQDNSKNTALHYAIMERRIHTVRVLLRHQSSYSLKNDLDNNALQTAALRGYSDIVETILEVAQVPVSDAIMAYELLGTNFVFEQDDMVAAVQTWKKAMALRYQCKSAPLLKQLPERQSVYLHLKEPETMEELNNLTDPEEIVMNSLMIKERILGPTHKDTMGELVYHGEIYATSHRYQRCVDLWKYAYKLNNLGSEPSNNALIRSLVKLFWEIHVEIETAPLKAQMSISDILDVLNILSEQITTVHTCLKIDFEIWQPELYSCLRVLLQLFLHLILLLSRMEKIDKQKHMYMSIIRRIIVLDPRGWNGESLMHMAIDANTSFIDGEFYASFPSLDAIKILVKCGANVDALKDNGNSPVYDCVTFFKLQHHKELANILDYLVINGAHVDICNFWGESALNIIENMALPFHTMNHVNLKCLASRVIMKYNIPYEDVLPRSLSPFVELHDVGDTD